MTDRVKIVLATVAVVALLAGIIALVIMFKVAAIIIAIGFVAWVVLAVGVAVADVCGWKWRK